ncbi:MAG: RNA polymerase sigma factor [Actinobacteria bacterium]|nr:RNA polymerase sigma factor [Actinomycetota bacterium]
MASPSSSHPGPRRYSRRVIGAGRSSRPGGPAADEATLVAGLRAGDEAAFAALIDAHHSALVRMAMVYVPSRAVAEDVVQETWLAVLEGIDRFEGRSSLKTWIFRILMNRAMTRGKRERRSVPFSSLVDPAREPSEPAVDRARFQGPGEANPGHWSDPPRSLEGVPEERLLSGELLGEVSRAIEALPPAQREVITLRDVAGWGSAEVCNALGITETNQRVLLHRARSKVRRTLERYLDEPA